MNTDNVRDISDYTNRNTDDDYLDSKVFGTVEPRNAIKMTTMMMRTTMIFANRATLSPGGSS